MRRAALLLAVGHAPKRARLATSAAAASVPLPPPPRYPKRWSNDNDKSNDPYAWMRTADNGGELAPYLAQEARRYRVAGLGAGPGAHALCRAIAELSSSEAAADGGRRATTTTTTAEPSGPYEYWQRLPKGEDEDEEDWALMRRPRNGEGSEEAAVVLCAAGVARDAALAARRFWPSPPRSSSLFSFRPPRPLPLCPENLFGPDFERTPPDVRLSRDHALLAYLLPYAPSAAARRRRRSTSAGAAASLPPEGASLLVVRRAVASDNNNNAHEPLAMVRAATGAEFSPWFSEADPRIYFVEPDAATGRPRRVRARAVPWPLLPQEEEEGDGCDIGGDSNNDLFDEADPRFFVALTRTKDWRALVVNSHSKVSSEVRLLLRSAGGGAEAATTQPPPQPQPTLVLVAPRRPGVEYFVEHRQGHVLVLTNAPQAFAGSRSRGGSSTTTAGAAAKAAARDYALLSAPLVRSDATHPSDWRLGTFVELSPEPTGRCLLSYAPSTSSVDEESDDDDDDDDKDKDNSRLPPPPIAANTDMDVFDAGVVLQQRDALGRPALTVLRPPTPDGSSTVVFRHRARLPSWALALEPAANQDPSAPAFRFDLSSPSRLPQPYELDLETGEVRPLRCLVSPAAAPSLLACRRLLAPCLPGDDGNDDDDEAEGVPVTLLCRRDDASASPSSAPPPITLIEAYGAYGRPLEACWRADRAALALALGWRVCLAHVRGGGELGRRWHAAGRGSRKTRSARDLVSVARFLVREGFAAEGRVALSAASAGAVAAAGALLTVAAADADAAPPPSGQRRLFGAAVLEVPFVDALAEMEAAGASSSDSSSSSASAALDLLAQHEEDEWGDDEDEDEGVSDRPSFRALERGACPSRALMRLTANGDGGGGRRSPRLSLPPLLLTAAADDARVRPQGVARFAALYRDASAAGRTSGGRPPSQVLLRLAAEGGHSGTGTSGGDAGEVAEMYEFVRREIEGKEER